MKSMKWFAMAGLVSLSMACGGVPDDSEMVKDLDEAQVTEMCADVCGDAGAYTLMCDGATLSSDIDEASCKSGCATLSAAKDSCTATVGDVRAANTKAENCDEAGASLAAAIKLAGCL